MALTRPGRAGFSGWDLLRIAIILVILGFVLPRLLGAITDYLFPTGGPAEPTLSQQNVPERAVYQSWLAVLIAWWHRLQRGIE